MDAIGRPVELMPEANLTIIGAAASAAAGAGLVPDLFAAAAAVAQPAITVRLDLAAHARYGELLAGQHLEATKLLAPLSRRLAARQLGGAA